MTPNQALRTIPAVLCAALIAAAVPALAHHKAGHAGGPPQGQAGQTGGGGDAAVTVSPAGATLRFDDVVIRLVNDWFRQHPDVTRSYPALPPGIAKNLARGKPLPPGIAKRYLPDGLTAKLPALPEGYGRFVVGDDLVLIELTTGLIHDIARILS